MLSLHHILLVVEQTGNQLLDPIDFDLLTHEWNIVVQVVEVAMVRHEEVILTLFLSQLTDLVLKLIWVLHPFEPTSQEVLAHCPTIQVIGIRVLKVMTLLSGVKPIAHVLVACLHIPMNCLSDIPCSNINNMSGSFGRIKLTSVFLRQICQANPREV